MQKELDFWKKIEALKPRIIHPEVTLYFQEGSNSEMYKFGFNSNICTRSMNIYIWRASPKRKNPYSGLLNMLIFPLVLTP